MVTETEKDTRTPEQKRLDAIEDIIGTLIDKVEALSKELEGLKKTTVKKSSGLFGGKREKTAVKDTSTTPPTMYPSKAAVGKALCDEASTTGDDHFAWYKLIAKFPERFVEMAADSPEAQKAWADQKALVEAEVAEANKKLEAEAAAKAAEEAKAAKTPGK